MITIVDCGLGNVGSLVNMLHKVGARCSLASDAEQLKEASKLILPGVGAFDNAVARLAERGFDEEIKRLVEQQHVPILGVCLGMQLLSHGSEEGPGSGLGLIPGRVVRFLPSSMTKRLPIPHMGWNGVVTVPGHPLFQGLEVVNRFYFVHSYHFECESSDHAVGTTRYGYEFTSFIARDHVYGAQFHPEKSHVFGMILLNNYADL